MYFSPKWLSRALGRWSASVCKRWPNLFLVFPSLGVALGILFIALPNEHGALRMWLMIMGVMLIVFYGGLIVMYLVKRRRGTWDEFCDWAHDIFTD